MSGGAAIGVACGLAAEARLARGAGVEVVCGRSPELEMRLRDRAEGWQAIVSFGIAGGLAPHLGAGDIVVAHTVTADAGRWRADERLVANLLRRLDGAPLHASPACLAAVRRPVASVKAKTALRDTTGAAAADMESACAAAVAEDHHLPFAALRVVCDPVRRRLPAMTEAAVAPDGSIRAVACVRALAAQPADVIALPALARDYVRALARLHRLRRFLGPAFGLVDF